MVFLKLFTKYYGIYEWLLIRFSAAFIFLYVMNLINFIFFSNTLSYEQWYEFFSKYSNKLSSIIVLLSILCHSWIGMHHILEDYIKFSILKCLGKWIINIILFIYLFLGMTIIWSV